MGLEVPFYNCMMIKETTWLRQPEIIIMNSTAFLNIGLAISHLLFKKTDTC